jgi:hypothetical protein
MRVDVNELEVENAQTFSGRWDIDIVGIVNG